MIFCVVVSLVSYIYIFIINNLWLELRSLSLFSVLVSPKTWEACVTSESPHERWWILQQKIFSFWHVVNKKIPFSHTGWDSKKPRQCSCKRKLGSVHTLVAVLTKSFNKKFCSVEGKGNTAVPSGGTRTAAGTGTSWKKTWLGSLCDYPYAITFWMRTYSEYWSGFKLFEKSA